MLLHHHDIQDLLQVRLRIRPNSSLTTVQWDEGELAWLLAESRVVERVEIDENGGEACSRRVNSSRVFTLGSWATGQPCSDRNPRGDPAGFRYRCKRPFISTMAGFPVQPAHAGTPSE